MKRQKGGPEPSLLHPVRGFVFDALLRRSWESPRATITFPRLPLFKHRAQGAGDA